ncbi:MAG: hypothetical protein HQK77_14235 [Desulfobacterales bacterium]|nr:hypothetical protein [Desulfobacterales bacterium]
MGDSEGEMTDTERIRKLAEWMGWQVRIVHSCFNPLFKGNLCICDGTRILMLFKDWNPYTRIQDAWTLLRRANEIFAYLEVELMNFQFRLEMELEKMVVDRWWQASEQEMCMAICAAIEKLMELKP